MLIEFGFGIFGNIIGVMGGKFDVFVVYEKVDKIEFFYFDVMCY